MTLPGRVPFSVMVCSAARASASSDELRQAEVEDLGKPVVRDHQVFRLEVPVHDPRLVRLREPVGDRRGNLQGAAERQRPGVQHLTQRLALDELHADVGLGLGLTEIVDGDDGGMIECGGRACFELEPPQAFGVVRQLGRQQLQRDVTIELGVVREIDLAHAAGAEQRANDVGPEARAQAVSGIATVIVHANRSAG